METQKKLEELQEIYKKEKSSADENSILLKQAEMSIQHLKVLCCHVFNKISLKQFNVSLKMCTMRSLFKTFLCFEKVAENNLNPIPPGTVHRERESVKETDNRSGDPGIGTETRDRNYTSSTSRCSSKF